jgi:hypothetical protein
MHKVHDRLPITNPKRWPSTTETIVNAAKRKNTPTSSITPLPFPRFYLTKEPSNEQMPQELDDTHPTM